MSLRIILAASAALALAAPALAQEAPAAPPAAEASSAAEIELQAKGDAFKVRMEQMQGEIEAAITGAGADEARGMADVEAILARYQPDIDGFIVAFETFMDTESAAAPDDATRQQMQAARTSVRTALGGLPAQLRVAAQSALAAQAAAATAPPAAAR